MNICMTNNYFLGISAKHPPLPVTGHDSKHCQPGQNLPPVIRTHLSQVGNNCCDPRPKAVPGNRDICNCARAHMLVKGAFDASIP